MPGITIELDEVWVQRISDDWIQNFSDHWWIFTLGLGALIISGNLFRTSHDDRGFFDWFFGFDSDGDGGD